MADQAATLSFLPWLRRGLANGITRPDALSAGTPDNAIDVTLAFNGGTLSVATHLDLVEPGDIVGFDPRAIVRTYPGANESDAEFHHLAMVEMDQADLPWRYTPAAAAADQLRPWMVLVVLLDSDAKIADATPDQKLPLLTINPKLLPDLTEAWAWAHVQVHGQTTQADLPGVAGTAGKVVARLVSPRVLSPKTAYRAVLVPTYERGRLAGTGGDPTGVDLLTFAWRPTDPNDVTLPVYYQWRFQTGAAGSFRDLVIALQPRQLPATVGQRPMDVTTPGLGLTKAASAPLAVEGALQSLAAQASPSPWDATEKNNWGVALANVVNTQQVTVPNNPPLKTVVPPLYGRWHAAQGALVPPGVTPPPEDNQVGANPPWFLDLNRDPRLRVGAALGTSVVQAHDQELMESAWRQIGDLKAFNEERRVLQVGREVLSRGFDRFIKTGNQGTFFGFTSLLHGRVLSGGSTIFSQLAGSRIPRAVFDPHWRRLSRPRGALGRRQGRPSLPATSTADFFDRLNTGALDPAPEPGTPGGMATFGGLGGAIVPGNVSDPGITILTQQTRDRLTFWGMLLFCVSRKLLAANAGRKWWWLLRMMKFGLALIRMAAMQQFLSRLQKLRAGTLTGTDVRTGPKITSFTPAIDSVPTTIPLPVAPPANPVDPADAAGFRTGLGDIMDALHFLRPPRPVGTTVNLTSIFNILVSALHPTVTIVESILRRLTLRFFWQAKDPLEVIMPAPDFPQPMWAPLRDQSPEWILPGLSGVQTDTLALLVTNQKFIEAFMVGLNHEMSRELLWNEYPTDQRGTYFRQFWDPRGYVQTAAETTSDQDALKEQFRDILPIHTWSRTGQLGNNSARRAVPGGGQHLVLLVRGELIHRYPNVIVYAARTTDINAEERHPVFSGRIGPDVAFYGFEIQTSDARGNPGWFFVLQEQPAEPRIKPPDTVAAESNVPAGLAIDRNTGIPARTGAEFASNMIEQRTRVAVHGSALLPTTP